MECLCRLTVVPSLRRQRTHGKHFRNAFHPATVHMEAGGNWKQYVLRQWTYTAGTVSDAAMHRVFVLEYDRCQKEPLYAIPFNT